MDRLEALALTGLPEVREGDDLAGLLAAAGEELPFDAVVGAEESAEYLRQSRRLVDAWGLGGVSTRYEELDGNHFTVIMPFADIDSAMTRRVAELCGA